MKLRQPCDARWVKPRIDPDRADQLYAEALGIQAEGNPGLWVPRMRYLAMRNYGYAMVELARWHADVGGEHDPIALRLYRRAYRLGHAQAAQHMAMACFNRGDMKGYRRWLRSAANAGDKDALREYRLFETRLPHSNARKIRRLRPWREDD